MIQEKKEIMAGLHLGKSGAQLTWYTAQEKEPVTVTSENGDEHDKIPVPPEAWAALEDRDADDAPLVSFLRYCLRLVPGYQSPEQMRVMMTVRELTPLAGERLPRSMEKLGLERKNIYVQDYRSSFFYYAVNQKRELWSGDVALFEYDDAQDRIVGSILHVDRSTTPALVTVTQEQDQKLDRSVRGSRNDQEWDSERDRLFFEFLKKVFDRRNVTTCYLMGNYFDRSWAPRSFQYLCFHRHAFQGNNLYTRGACYAAMERAGALPLPGLLFLGADIVRENMGMMMRIRGKETYYPVVSAGINWYEAHHTCEFIPDGERSVSLITRPMTGGLEVTHVLRLTGFPDRPNRATRLRLTVYFTSPDCCVTEVEDLGFGGFYKPSGKKWKREIHVRCTDEL